MRVLGLDPGTALLGYGAVDCEGGDVRNVEHGVIRTAAGLPLATRLVTIHEELARLVRRLQPDQTAVEQLFFSRNVTNALAVGHARGVILLTLAEAHYEVFEYTPMQVKQALVGYGGADKAQMQTFLALMLGLPEPPRPDDAADALAVAICHYHSHRLVELEAAARSRR